MTHKIKTIGNGQGYQINRHLLVTDGATGLDRLARRVLEKQKAKAAKKGRKAENEAGDQGNLCMGVSYHEALDNLQKHGAQ